MAKKTRSSSTGSRAAGRSGLAGSKSKPRAARPPIAATFADFATSELAGLAASIVAISGRADLAAAALPAALAAAALARPRILSSMLTTRVAAVPPAAPKGLNKLAIDVEPSMDPRLQLAIANRQTGKPGLTLAATAEDEIAVIARVVSVEEWLALADVVPGSMLGQTYDGGWIVTGRLPLESIERVRADPVVISLKASQPVRPALAATLPAMGVVPPGWPAGTDPQGGSGIVVGFVDFGCDFAHGNFRHPNGNSRILGIWHQAGVAQPDSPLGYGRLHAVAEINAALAAPNPYAALGYGPAPDGPAQTGTHGTHVMDIAVGNGRGSTQPGVAPAADIIFVDPAISDIAWQGSASATQVFGDSVQLLEAVRFIFDQAGERPCVVNISLGTNGGPHDGTSLVERGLDALLNEKPNRAVVIAASNSQQHGIHQSGEVPANGVHDIRWRQRNFGGGEVEVWYAGARRLEVTLVGSDGTTFGPVAPGSNLPIGSAGQVAIFITNRLNDPNNHDNVVGIWVAEGLSNDDWTIRLRSLDGNAVAYHAWIERNDGLQASFASPVPTHTLGSISTGQATIVVGSYDGHKPARPLSSFSSSGPTRDGRNKPEISAPGQDVIAARSRTGTGVTRKSGTSMAAPAVTGLVALIFGEARRNGHDLDITALRNRLISGVLTNPPSVGAGTWDSRYGFGRASGASVQDAIV
ncbi:MAG: peptidase S8/S53 subtilisin kexin sedolisin [Mesorhizobium sp.]|nr:MAG: peptidase S8/S53 subtilisin kexin sedolisin [Mesorhizobium sp.]